MKLLDYYGAKRDIKEIAPEELAAGMFEILKQNVSADRNGLYHSLAVLCGITRVGRAVNAAMDRALQCLKEFVVIDDTVTTGTTTNSLARFLE